MDSRAISSHTSSVWDVIGISLLDKQEIKEMDELSRANERRFDRPDWGTTIFHDNADVGLERWARFRKSSDETSCNIMRSPSELQHRKMPSTVDYVLPNSWRLNNSLCSVFDLDLHQLLT